MHKNQPQNNPKLMSKLLYRSGWRLMEFLPCASKTSASAASRQIIVSEGKRVRL